MVFVVDKLAMEWVMQKNENSLYLHFMYKVRMYISFSVVGAIQK